LWKDKNIQVQKKTLRKQKQVLLYGGEGLLLWASFNFWALEKILASRAPSQSVSELAIPFFILFV
jgi:hypothetical protein